MAYSQTVTVRFEDVDFARVVYFPNLFAYCHRVFEDFFRDELGIPYARMLGERKVGFPAVSAKADFKAPFRFGDACRIDLETARVGDKSITCRYRLFNGEMLGAEVEITVAVIDMATFRATAVPPDVRAGFEKHAIG